MATIKGKWKWQPDDSIVRDNNYDGAYASFVSNGRSFEKLAWHWTTGIWCISYIAADGIEVAYRSCSYPEIADENPDYQIIDFGDTEQDISDEVYNFIMTHAIPYAGTVEFLNDVKMKKDLRVEGSAYVSDKKVLVEGDVTADTYTKDEIDAKFLADYVVSDETSTATLRKTGFFVSGNLEETEEYWAWSDEYGYTQTVWPSIRYDYSRLEPKSLTLGQDGQGYPDREGIYYANYSKLAHTENALDIFHTSLDIAGGVQLKLANDKILGELADWKGHGGQNLFTATVDLFEAPSFKTSGTITIGETTINEELLKKLLASANMESLMGEYGEASF